MRLTPELIENSYQYTNKATSDRELRLRALQINAIENLGATLNQFDCLDLSDNSIRKLENLPLLTRLKCLLLNNNRIYKISSNLEESIPNLERLILTNNYIQELGDIDPLSTLKNLKTLSLINNPITSKPHYRYYVIHKLPSVKLLDFSKVKQVEREESAKLFSGTEGDLLAKSIGIKSKVVDEQFQQELESRNEELRKRRCIDDARTAQMDAMNMQSIARINNLLKSGHVPGVRTKKQGDTIEDIDIQAQEEER